MNTESTLSTRLGLIISIVLAGAMLTGCTISKVEAGPQPEQTDEAMSDTELDLLGSVTANAPPKDLLWDPPTSLPEGWTSETIDEEGVILITVSPRCRIQFHQPAGMGDTDDPDSAQVALDFSTELGKEAFDAELTVTAEDPVMLNATINDGAMNAKLSFARVSFTAQAIPDLVGTTYALRSGDYAVIATAVCADGEFATQGDNMREFIESARANVTY